VHGRDRVAALLSLGTVEEARRFYAERWDSWRWRALFRIFFSRTVMGAAGRDPAFFRYVEGSVGSRILERTRHALTEIPPVTNPYLHWILTGTYGEALPHALREESFEPIRARLDRLEWRLATLEDWMDGPEAARVDAWNLSDIFEYMSEEATETLLGRLAEASAPGARLAYWNMLAPRSRPERLAGRLVPQAALAARLHAEDKAFFYSRFVVEEVAG
jgi:S-adenosylmethionine-diacylglycerol 3-amino-3-carboxypropyl transferase